MVRNVSTQRKKKSAQGARGKGTQMLGGRGTVSRVMGEVVWGRGIQTLRGRGTVSRFVEKLLGKDERKR